MNYLAAYDTDGKYMGFYPSDMFDLYTDIPVTNIELTEEQHQEAMTGNYKVVDGAHTYNPYVPTTEETVGLTKSTKLAEIKAKLSATDYKCLKFVDGELTEAEYYETKALRSTLREAYNTIKDAKTIDEINAVNY
ncbi:hypothetical protein SPSIL_002620 [Sporomusa silvacetica DSM 10669]|uniref:Phage protein n=1 Tax=Sporomusa silvacetica DSM 10669 TaxID=1123289 RepID=A0ABZ3IEV0_9FIRM|nr:hypothetical protein [Sporomusa silvacetica]OZC17836.1 hypothetical protein SPSIL_29760 [Sporomusa silvacetica DSM 10669]